MFPDLVVFRVVLRLLIGILDAVGPTSTLWTALSFLTFPAPPVIIALPLDTVYALDAILWRLNSYFLVESAFLVLHTFTRRAIAWGWWDLSPEPEAIGSEERWRIWIKMLESDEDPWSWLGGMFLLPGKKTAPEGIEDPAVTVRRETVGRANIEEFITHYLFGCKLRAIKRNSLERAELHSMVLLLEYVMTQSQANTEAKSFVFARGKTKHKVFQLNEEPIVTRHQPLLFYLIVWLASAAGNLALWAAGFRYYGQRFQLFPLFIMRGSGRALDRLLPPGGEQSDTALADKVGYWFHPGSKKAQDEGSLPVMFFHGISGTYGPSPFVCYLRWKTGRPFFVPEFPYVTMRLRPPSAIVTRRETVAAARRMLFRHGFGLTNVQDEDVEEGNEEEWRRGKAIMLGHSLGSGPVTWVLRDAPDIVSGLVLIDPMSVLLYAADAPRNFFRTRVKTASEIFFKYFAQERGINHFLSRHLRWSDSNALTTSEPPWRLPNYAPVITPCPSGPLPAVFFYSELDCILPVQKILKYLRACGFNDTNLHVIPKADHASILLRPHWIKRVSKAIEEVSKAADVVEKRWKDDWGGR